MWHSSALFFLRRFPGLSESALWKDPLHLLLQPANYNTVIKLTQQQLPPYITVSDKHTATSSCAMLSSNLRKVESWVRLSLVWLLPEDTGNAECCLTCRSVKNEHAAMHRNGPKAPGAGAAAPPKLPELDVFKRPKRLHCCGCSISPLKQLDCFSTSVAGSWISAKIQSRNKIPDFLQFFNSSSLFWFQHSQHPFLYDNNRP